jgi:uncharacterized protein YcbX
VAVRVAQVWRYPVKSMQGEALDALDVGPERIPGDREWGVRDSATGGVLTAREARRLIHASARLEGDTVCVTLPDGRELREDDDITDLALSSFVGKPVHLARAKQSEQQTFETMSAFSAAEPTLVRWASTPGSFNDGAAVHIVTTASLRAAAAMHPKGVWDVRRFRPNLLVDVDGDDYVEDEWSRIRVGNVELEVYKKSTRCTITARAQPGLPEDLDVPRALARNRQAKLGVYAHITIPGTIAPGDDVQTS